MPLRASQIHLDPNKPELLRLKYKSGKPCTSIYDGPQVMFTCLTDAGQVGAVFVPPNVANTILTELRIKPGERFTLCKRQGSKEAEISWEVVRIDLKPNGPEPTEDPSRPASYSSEVPRGGTTQHIAQQAITPAPPASTLMSRALIVALEAVRDAEAHGQAIGRPVQFNSRDISAIGMSCYIAHTRRSA